MGIGVTILTIFNRALAFSAIINFVRYQFRRGLAGAWFWTDVAIVTLSTMLALVGHLIDVVIWAIAFTVCGEFASLAEAILYSGGSYTTLGSGLVVSPLRTFEWILQNTCDGSRQNSPRELIHLLSAARQLKLRRFEVGQTPPDGDCLFDAVSLTGALPEVARVRFQQTLCAEYPHLRDRMQQLENEKSEHTPDTVSIADCQFRHRTPDVIDRPDVRGRASSTVVELDTAYLDRDCQSAVSAYSRRRPSFWDSLTYARADVP